jgi:hypothetical protein
MEVKMKKIFNLMVLAIFFILAAFSLSSAQEQITITTYYPSPYGNYRELRAQRIAIGDSYSIPSSYCWSPDTCTYLFDPNIDLAVEGNVSIGSTTSFLGKLYVYAPSNSGLDGIDAYSADWWGVYANSPNNYGVYGQSTNSYGVYGQSTNSYGVYGQSYYSNGIYGYSLYSTGIYGYSPNNYAIIGYTPSSAAYDAIWGYAPGSLSAGVYGYGGGYGVIGLSPTTGVEGHGNYYGVYGSSDQNWMGGPGVIVGVFGKSDSGLGVAGRTYSNM